MRISHSSGRYLGSGTEIDIVAGPIRAWAQPQVQPGIVWAGGLGMTPTSALGQGVDASFWPCIDSIANRYPTIMAQLGSTAEFANDTHLLRIGSAKTFLQGASSPTRAKAGAVSMVGASMGAGAQLAYARANPTHVACLALVVPMVSISTLWSTNRGGTLTGIINAAWQQDFARNYNPAVDDATRDARAFGAQITMPVKIWAVTADATILLSEIQAFDAVAPNCEVVQIGGTHSAPAFPATFVDDLYQFLKAHEP